MTDIMWTPALDGRLRELHAADTPFSEIAKTLEREFKITATRNAIIGRARRIELPPRQTPKSQLKKQSPKPRKPREKFVVVKPRPIQDIVPMEPAADLVIGAITMAQLTLHTCHWPIGSVPPYSYCGSPTYKGSSFCAPHYKLAYVAPRERWA